MSKNILFLLFIFLVVVATLLGFYIVTHIFFQYTNAIEIRDTPEYDWLVCGSVFQQVADQYDITWTWEEMYDECYELINSHQVVIERDGERNIVIYWYNLGDTIKIDLPVVDQVNNP